MEETVNEVQSSRFMLTGKGGQDDLHGDITSLGGGNNVEGEVAQSAEEVEGFVWI